MDYISGSEACSDPDLTLNRDHPVVLINDTLYDKKLEHQTGRAVCIIFTPRRFENVWQILLRDSYPCIVHFDPDMVILYPRCKCNQAVGWRVPIGII